MGPSDVVLCPAGWAEHYIARREAAGSPASIAVRPYGEGVGTPPLPYRVRPPQILLGVGAVLLVSAGAAVVSAHGGPWTRALLLVLAVAAAGGSLLAARSGLRTSPEVLAA